MVLKKSNTKYNSGATQRASLIRKNKQLSCGRGDIFGYNCNAHHLAVTLPITYSSLPLRINEVSEIFNFLTNFLGLEELGLEAGGWNLKDLNPNWARQQSFWYNITASFSLNKKKRWLLPERLTRAVILYNFIHSRLDLERINKKSKHFPTEMWDSIASDWFPKRDFIFKNKGEPLFDDERELVQFGLMDLFSNVSFNVSEMKDSLGFTLRGHARDKSHCTIPSKNSDVDFENQKQKKSKKKKAVPHHRGIQRKMPMRAKPPLEKHIKRKQQRYCDINPETTIDHIDITYSQEPHTDPRILGLDSVIKKYGHQPYNAPRVAICKTKSRPKGRLGIHRGFTFARLKEEIELAEMEIHESNDHLIELPNVVCGYDFGADLESTMQQQTEETESYSEYSMECKEITLNDFFIAPAITNSVQKKQKRTKKRHRRDNLEFFSFNDDALMLQTLDRTSCNRILISPSNIVDDWEVISSIDSDASILSISSDVHDSGDSFND